MANEFVTRPNVANEFVTSREIVGLVISYAAVSIHAKAPERACRADGWSCLSRGTVEVSLDTERDDGVKIGD